MTPKDKKNGAEGKKTNNQASSNNGDLEQKFCVISSLPLSTARSLTKIMITENLVYLAITEYLTILVKKIIAQNKIPHGTYLKKNKNANKEEFVFCVRTFFANIGEGQKVRLLTSFRSKRVRQALNDEYFTQKTA